MSAEQIYNLMSKTFPKYLNTSYKSNALNA